MTEWARILDEVIQFITPDGETITLTTESNKGDWVLEMSGWGLPGIDYISQQGPYQHGATIRDYRLKPRVVQMLVRQQACDRDDYWARRTGLLDTVRPNRSPLTFIGSWLARSQPDLANQYQITSLVEFENDLYGGTTDPTGADGGRLFRWDDVQQWFSVAGILNAQDEILSLIVFDDGSGDAIFGGTGGGGRLFKWDGVSAWAQVCAALNGQARIHDMVLFDDGLGGGTQIFAGTSAGGRLFHYSVGGGAWIQVCAQLGAETHIHGLAVFDDGGGDDLYGCTEPGGRLYQYNPGGAAWVQVCPQLGAITIINDIVVYAGNLYGGADTGELLQYNVAGGAWVQVAPSDGVTSIRKLVVYQGRLYGAGSQGSLLRWNNVDAWEQMCGQYVANTSAYSLLVFNNRLFCGQGSILAGTYRSYLLEYVRRTSDTELPCGTLRRVLSDGSIRDLCCYIEQGPEFTHTRDGWDEFSIEEVLRFIAPDPIIYDPAEQTGPTYTMGVGAILETHTLTYEGTWREHPVLTIIGPLYNPIIRNEDTDEFISLDYEIPAGRTVTITLTPGNQTVEDDLGVNLIGTVTPESNLATFHLAADPEVEDGDNDITIIGTDAAAATRFAITYYNRYIGI